jgi:hypothetical protein
MVQVITNHASIMLRSNESGKFRNRKDFNLAELDKLFSIDINPLRTYQVGFADATCKVTSKLKSLFCYRRRGFSRITLIVVLSGRKLGSSSSSF